MHDESTIEAVYLDIISLAKGKALKAIGDKHGVALPTLYLWRKDFKNLAAMAPGVVGVGGRRGECPADGLDVEAEQAGEKAAPDVEEAAEPPDERSRGRQRDGYYSLPIVAAMVGKSEREVREIVRDYNIKPETILVQRPKRNVPGYSEESIQKIKDREPRTVDSMELRKILRLRPHTYQHFLEYILLRTEEPMYGRRFSRIRRALVSHEKSHTYRFDRDMIPDFQALNEQFIEENDGRKRSNRERKRHLRALREKKNGVTTSTPRRTENTGG